MKKYSIPYIKISCFSRENVVTQASGDLPQNTGYIDVVQTMLNETPTQYAARKERFSNLLKFTD